MQINILGIKLNLKNDLEHYYAKYVNPILDIFVILRLKFCHKYKILPFGTYCFSRVITTFAKIKPSKKEGEKSIPFDLAGFEHIGESADIVDSGFANFFDTLYFDEEKKYWIVKKYGVRCPHEAKLTKEEVIERYTKRIENFYEYLNNKEKYKFIHFLIATHEKVEPEELQKAVNVLKKFRNEKEFDIIYLNQAEKDFNYEIPNVYVINQGYNFKLFMSICDPLDWVGLVKKRDCKAARKVYYDAVFAILRVIEKATLKSLFS